MPVKPANNEMIKDTMAEELKSIPKALVIAPVMYVIALIKIITTAPFWVIVRCNRVMRRRSL